MSSPFVAEIRIFGFNFAPTGWAQCNGQLMPIAQNTALFSLVGTYYGGDGDSTFALPDLQGRAPMNFGQSNTGTIYDLGQASGTSSITLLQSEIPVHTHTLRGANESGEQSSLTSNAALAASRGGNVYQSTVNANLTPLSIQATAVAGASFPHNNMQPYLTLMFAIALQGMFPSRP